MATPWPPCGQLAIPMSIRNQLRVPRWEGEALLSRSWFKVRRLRNEGCSDILFSCFPGFLTFCFPPYLTECEMPNSVRGLGNRPKSANKVSATRRGLTPCQPKAGARVVKHSGRLLVDVSRAAGVLWGRLLDRIQRWWRDEAWGRPRPRTRAWVPPPRHAHLHLVFRQ